MEIEGNEFIIDVLKEVGNIGAGNAATSLAKMVSKKINMSVPDVKILELDEVAKVLNGEENIIVGIYFYLEGDIVGNMLFALSIESAKNLSGLMYPRERESEELDDMDKSILSETGNIIAASYANSLASLTGLDILISVPSLTIDMAGAILSVPAIQFGLISDKAIMIETVFEEEDNVIEGNFFLLPDLESFEKILKSLGVM